MLDGEALRQVGKLIADCDRRLLPHALTEEYFDALARAAATAVKGGRGRPCDVGRRNPAAFGWC